jgi:hypothetical protein
VLTAFIVRSTYLRIYVRRVIAYIRTYALQCMAYVRTYVSYMPRIFTEQLHIRTYVYTLLIPSYVYIYVPQVQTTMGVVKRQSTGHINRDPDAARKLKETQEKEERDEEERLERQEKEKADKTKKKGGAAKKDDKPSKAASKGRVFI